MAKLFSDYFNLKHESLIEKGIFDPIIGFDTRLFLDPHLLKKTLIPEFKESRQHILKYYTELITILTSYLKHKTDTAYNAAYERLIFREMEGIFTGYGTKGRNGSAIGPKLANRLLKRSLEILKMGIDDVRSQHTIEF